MTISNCARDELEGSVVECTDTTADHLVCSLEVGLAALGVRLHGGATCKA
jgi:hypothetical protein